MSSGSVIDIEIPYSVIVRISNETQASANPTRSHNNNNSTIDGVLLRQDVDKLSAFSGGNLRMCHPLTGFRSFFVISKTTQVQVATKF